MMTPEQLKELGWEPRTSKRLPIGYVRNEDAPEDIQLKGGDPKLCIPDPRVIEHIEAAFDELDKGQSLREVSDWLFSKIGIKVSYVAIKKIWEKHRPNSPILKERQKERSRMKKAKMTRAEWLEHKRLQKLIREKKRLAHTKRKVEKVQKELQELRQETEELQKPSIKVKEYDFTEVDNLDEEQEITFRPNPGPQTEFLASDEFQVLYGGAAGGGKSYALLVDPARYFFNKNFSGLILRRTNDELRELISKAQDLYKRTWGDLAQWREKDKEFRFKDGGRLWFTYLEDDRDVLRYQGQSFTYVAFDELTQYPTPYPWNYLSSRVRTTDPNLPCYMRATSNPGGPGHSWVKKMFIDPAPFGEAFWATDIDTGEILTEPDIFPIGHPQAGQPNPKAGQPLFKRKFIPAKLFDNPYLANTNYYRSLLSLPEQQRRQLLEGDWSVADGAAFEEFRYDTHVCKPFPIPRNWRRFRSCDFGYSSASAVHWYAIDPVYETLYVYRELYTSKMTARTLARKILELEKGEKIAYGVLDSSCWSIRGNSGPTIAEEMISEGCRWRPSDRSSGSRTAGKNRLHELLQVREFRDGTKRPGIIFFDTCRQIIADLPSIPADPNGDDDIDKKYATDHTYDSIRYGIMTRPRPGSPFEEFNHGKPSYSYRPSDNRFGY